MPAWFYDYYDAIKMNKSIHPAECIRQIPLYIRWRWREVENILREVRFERAQRAKATFVYDFAKA